MATYASIKYNFIPPAATTSAQVGAGAMTLIKSIDSDGSDATIDFVNGASDVVFDSTYKTYIFKFLNVHPEDNAETFSFQVDTGTNTSYNQTITSAYYAGYHNEADDNYGLTYVAAYDQAQGTAFQPLFDKVSNAGDSCTSGELWIFNPSDTTFEKHFLSRCQGIGNGDYTVDIFAGGYVNTTTALTRVQFKFSGGEIQGGTIKLYGIA